MANGNFVVQNGLTVGPLTIDAATGSITTSGSIGGTVYAATETVVTLNATTGNITNIGTSNIVAASGTFTGNVGVTGNVNMTGHIVPTANITYSLGNRNFQWKDIWVGPGTLYLNGKAVLQDNSGTITVSTTAGQNLQLATSSGGTLQLTTNAGGGVIAVQGPLQVAAGNNVTSSDGNPIQFANAIGVDTISTHTNNTNLSLSAQGTGKIAVNNSITGGGTVTIADTTVTTSSTTGALVVAGGVGVNGDLRISGNVYSNGILAVQTSQLSVNAPLVYLAASPSYPYSYEIGLYSHFIGGAANAYSHTGMVRDHADNTWKFFANCSSEPTTTVNWSDPNLYYDKVKTGDHIIANTTASTSTTTGALQVSGGAGIGGAAYIGGVLNVAGATTLSSALTYGGVTLTNSVTGTGKMVLDTSPTFTTQITTPVIAHSGTTGVGDIGSSGSTFATVYATTFSGVSTTAKYADLAENYQGDKTYNPGTVVMFGGSAEVTAAEADTTAVAGVVSTNPAHLMNGQLTGANVVPVAFTGRVPCQVIGPVKKGDLMVSAGFGYAKASADPKVGQVIGKALQEVTFAGKAVIEVVVGRF